MIRANVCMMAGMQTITITEVTRAPGRVLDQVFRGATMLVTRHGRPYVVLSPPPPDTPEGDDAE